MVFQQLGQLLRWTWGYSVLLKPSDAYDEDERDDLEDRPIAEGERYRDDPDLATNQQDANKSKPNGKTPDSGVGSEGSSSASIHSGPGAR